MKGHKCRLDCSKSNLAMMLLNFDDLVVPSVVPIADKSILGSVVIALSSDKFATSAIGTIDVELAIRPCSQKGKAKLLISMILMTVAMTSLYQVKCLQQKT